MFEVHPKGIWMHIAKMGKCGIFHSLPFVYQDLASFPELCANSLSTHFLLCWHGDRCSYFDWLWKNLANVNTLLFNTELNHTPRWLVWWWMSHVGMFLCLTTWYAMNVAVQTTIPVHYPQRRWNVLTKDVSAVLVPCLYRVVVSFSAVIMPRNTLKHNHVTRSCVRTSRLEIVLFTSILL